MSNNSAPIPVSVSVHRVENMNGLDRLLASVQHAIDESAETIARAESIIALQRVELACARARNAAAHKDFLATLINR